MPKLVAVLILGLGVVDQPAVHEAGSSKPHAETFRLWNHPVCGFAAATPPNLGGDTPARSESAFRNILRIGLRLISTVVPLEEGWPNAVRPGWSAVSDLGFRSAIPEFRVKE